MAIRETFISRLKSDPYVAERLASLKQDEEPMIAAMNSESFGEQPSSVSAFQASAPLERQAIKGRLQTSFFRAAETGDVVHVMALIEAGYPVNTQDARSGETALHIAAAANAVDVVRVLVSSGECDYLIRDAKGRLAAELAFAFGDNLALGRLLARKARKQGAAQDIRVTVRP